MPTPKHSSPHNHEPSSLEAFAHKLRQDLRRWQVNNPTWEDIVDIDVSKTRDRRTLDYRNQCYHELVDLLLMSIQRHHNEHKLPEESKRSSFPVRYAASEVVTMSQHARGQRLQLPPSLDDLAANAIKFADDHLCGNLATDVIGTVHRWVKDKAAKIEG